MSKTLDVVRRLVEIQLARSTDHEIIHKHLVSIGYHHSNDDYSPNAGGPRISYIPGRKTWIVGYGTVGDHAAMKRHLGI